MVPTDSDSVGLATAADSFAAVGASVSVVVIGATSVGIASASDSVVVVVTTISVEVESTDESVLVATADASGAVVVTTNSIAVVALLLVGGVAACSISVLVVLSHTVNVDASGILVTAAALGIGAVVEVATVISWVSDVGAPTLGCFSLNPSGLLLK